MHNNKICLNMIVKNESKIIRETLLNLSKYIDYWVISDTGSTDNTIEVIVDTFNSLNIPGKIYQDTWCDFATNRTIAINHAYNICDYIWVMDADDIVIGNFELPEQMDLDMYDLKFGFEFTYKRSLIFKSSLKWKYRCVVHEFIECIDKKKLSNDVIQGEYYIESRRLGNRNMDPEKYLKDAQILIKAVEENKEPDLKSRYLFYIGQSFYDYKKYDDAILWYKKRIVEKGWNEESYYASLKIGFSMEKLLYSEDKIIEQYLHTYAIVPERPEALYHLGIYLKNQALILSDLDAKKEKLSKSLYYLKQLDKYKNNAELNSNRLILNTSIYKWTGLYELAIVNYHLDNKFESLKICKELLDNNFIRLNNSIFEKIESLKNLSINPNDEKLIIYPKKQIDLLITNQNQHKNSKLNKKNIICTMTTCKRLNLFIPTINSFINCCKDIELIDKWIFIDDNSSIEDRETMKYEYPFIEWIFKDKDNKGHANSMNMIQKLTTDYKYVLHLEDDWKFIEKTYYIKPALDILESEQYNFIDNRGINIVKNKEIAQVLFNINYSEDLSKIIYGGYLTETTTNCKTKFIIHEHYPDNIDFSFKNKPNCAYWTHYSFRPSIFKRKIFNELGAYDLKGFFEKKYADKYYNAGYLSCFYDKITCLHIGKKAGSTEGFNAYDLNNVNQCIPKNNLKLLDNNNFIFISNLDSFGNDIVYLGNKSIDELYVYSLDLTDCICFNTYGYLKNKLNNNLVQLHNKLYSPDGLYININKLHLEIICLNLKRRNDRKEIMKKQFEQINIRYNFFEATDGMELKPSEELTKLFKNNDFASRKGVIGCALSHKNIWEQLVQEKYKKYYIIFEDDVKLHKKFKEYLIDVQEIMEQLCEWDIIFLGYHTNNNNKYLYKFEDFDSDIEIIITEYNADHYIGGTHSYIISKSGAIKILEYIKTNGIVHGIDYVIKIIPNLIIYQLSKFIVDSDWVQNINSSVDSDIQKNFDFLDIYSDENFQYFRGMDSYSDDIQRKQNLSIDELKKIAVQDNNCVCFNSLGYLKSKLNNLIQSPHYLKSDDGIYIKKQYVISDTKNIKLL